MKKINEVELLELWLKKYHNTTFEEVELNHPEWKDGSSEHIKDFYNTYTVTQEQHDEWEKEAKNLIKKVTKCSKVTLERGWPWIYLNTSPKIKEDDIDNN